jgi:hypothetical protein
MFVQLSFFLLFPFYIYIFKIGTIGEHFDATNNNVKVYQTFGWRVMALQVDPNVYGKVLFPFLVPKVSPSKTIVKDNFNTNSLPIKCPRTILNCE